MGRRSQGKSVWSGKHGSSWSIFSPAVGWEAVVGSIHSLSHVQLFVTPWTVADQAPLSMGFSRQEYWSGLSFPSPGDLPNPGIEPRSPTLLADALLSEPSGKPSFLETSSMLIGKYLLLPTPFCWKFPLDPRMALITQDPKC